MLVTQVTNRRGVFDEFIRPADTNDRRLNLLVGQMISDDAAVAAFQHMILDGHDDIRSLGKKLGRTAIDRLGEARVDDGDVDVFSAKFLNGVVCDRAHRAKRKKCHLWFPVV